MQNKYEKTNTSCRKRNRASVTEVETRGGTRQADRETVVGRAPQFSMSCEHGIGKRLLVVIQFNTLSERWQSKNLTEAAQQQHSTSMYCKKILEVEAWCAEAEK